MATPRASSQTRMPVLSPRRLGSARDARLAAVVVASTGMAAVVTHAATEGHFTLATTALGAVILMLVASHRWQAIPAALGADTVVLVGDGPVASILSAAMHHPVQCRGLAPRRSLTGGTTVILSLIHI